MTQDVKQFMRRQRWDASNAKAYDAFRWLSRSRGWETWLRGMLEGVAPGATVLEMGAGTGYITAILARMGYRVLGFDLSDDMLARAQDTLARQGLAGTVRLWQGDAERVDLPDASVDAVVSRWVLWTLPDPRACLAEAARLLRPGGTAVFIDGSVLKQGRLARLRGQWMDYLLTGRKPGWRDACYANFDSQLPRIDAGQIAECLEAHGLRVLRVDREVDRATDGLFMRWLRGDGWASHAVAAVKPA